MLRTLRITSRVAIALAVCGVIFMIFFGLRGDSDITTYLEKPGVIQQFQDRASESDKKESESPLVTQAHEFALRIDPPPPPQPVQQPPKNPDVIRVVKQDEPPSPKDPVSAKFELLATVQCETDPARSMVLLKQATGKEEWFWLGENVGHLKIDDVRNGSAIFSQNGQKPLELFVPVKLKAPSLLKGEAATSASLPARLGGIMPTDEASALPAAVSQEGSPAQVTTEPAESPQRSAFSRIRRLRTGGATPAPPVPQEPVREEPKRPTLEEQKVSLEESISGIQEIMSRQDGSGDSKQRQEETKAWKELLETLQNEKKNLESAVKPTEKADETPAEQPQPEGEEPESRVPEKDPNQE